MAKEITRYVLLGLIILAGSCSAPWDSRFDAGTNADSTVWELISGNSAYSGFRTLLEETGTDSILQRNTSFTVFAVPDEYFPVLSGLTEDEKTGLALYQISNFVLYTGDIMNGTTIKTLNGKRLSFTISDGTFIVNDESELLRTDITASNGVIHEVSGIQQLRPNLLEYIYEEDEYSTIRDFFAEGTVTTFDQENSVPTGIDDDGQTIYDTVWKQSNEFFTNSADPGSEDEQYTFFLASNELLDTAAEGSYKSGYISNLANFIIEGLVFESDLPGTFQAVNGFSLNIREGNYTGPEKLSNGRAYAINGFGGIRIPGKVRWEVTDVSDFDSVRNVSTAEYAGIYDQLQDIEVSELTGTIINLKYEFDPMALNGDYLKIILENNTTMKIGIRLPDLLPGKYMVRMGVVLRAVGGLAFDAILNGKEIGSGLNMNGGKLQWEVMDIGTGTIVNEKNNVLTLDITGGQRGYIDYLIFEPVN